MLQLSDGGFVVAVPDPTSNVAAVSGVSSINGRAGAVLLSESDIGPILESAVANLVPDLLSKATTAYVDTGDTTTLASAKSYADTKDAANLSTSESFATSGDTTTLASAKSYADTGDAANLSTAESFATSGDTTTLASAKSYADTGDASTLVSAKSYTDTQIAAANARALVFAIALGG